MDNNGNSLLRTCHLCEANGVSLDNVAGMATHFRCVRCGEYSIDNDFITDSGFSDKRGLIARFLYETNNRNRETDGNPIVINAKWLTDNHLAVGRCDLCDSFVNAREQTAGSEDGALRVVCEFCGEFKLKSNYAQTDDFKRQRHIVAGYLYETENRFRTVRAAQSIPIIEANWVYEASHDSRWPRSIYNKLEKLLLWWYKQDLPLDARIPLYVGGATNVTFEGGHVKIPPSAVYARSSNETAGMLKMMEGIGWVHSGGDRSSYYSFSAAGMKHAEELLTTNIESNKVFVATKLDKIRNRIYQLGIKRAWELCGLISFTVEEEESNNLIDDNIIAGIKRSKFVIVNLSQSNNGAYFEAGFAKGLGREVIYICDTNWFNEGKGVHFDTSHCPIIVFDEEGDLSDLIKALKARIRGVFDDVKMNDD